MYCSWSELVYFLVDRCTHFPPASSPAWWECRAERIQAVAVSSLGKWKTATQMIAIIAMLIARDFEAGWATSAAVGGLGLMYISAILGEGCPPRYNIYSYLALLQDSSFQIRVYRMLVRDCVFPSGPAYVQVTEEEALPLCNSFRLHSLFQACSSVLPV